MPKSVILVEINVFERMVPLVSGYLQAYASADPELRRDFSFQHYTATCSTDVDRMLTDLAALDADVYAFSCYLWNIRLVQKLLRQLYDLKPRTQFLLGGPQVMHHVSDYVRPRDERIAVCNGEGEKTFANYLRALTATHPDLESVRGLSFYRDGTLRSTEAESRMRDLDEIPSPFTGELFGRAYEMSVLETNRGCPFRCGFCFWGAATNDKVVKFSDDRVQADLQWIGKNNVPFLFLADANWGMLKRDIEFSRHIARSKLENGLPVYVYFSAAKNSPQRVTEITDIFKQAALLNAQPISLQTMSENSLQKIDRSNIKLSAYEELQGNLNDKKTSSFIELIWPLPGETLASFKEGIETLCDKGATHLITYPHLLLHNTPLYAQRETHGLVTRLVDDGASEAELVVQTTDVSGEDFEEGLWFFYVVLALYNARALPDVTAYLRASHGITYSGLYTDFVRYCRQHPEHAFSHYCERSIADADYYDVHNYAMVHHLVSHSARDDFDLLLHGFASSQPWWKDETARALFELDLLARPFIYSNTPVKAPVFPLESVSAELAQERAYAVQVAPRVLQHSGRVVTGHDLKGHNTERCTLHIDHKRQQHPLRPNQDRQRTANYCNGVVMRIESIRPRVSQADARSTVVSAS